jgi:hypothetical protein
MEFASFLYRLFCTFLLGLIAFTSVCFFFMVLCILVVNYWCYIRESLTMCLSVLTSIINAEIHIDSIATFRTLSSVEGIERVSEPCSKQCGEVVGSLYDIIKAGACMCLLPVECAYVLTMRLYVVFVASEDFRHFAWCVTYPRHNIAHHRANCAVVPSV